MKSFFGFLFVLTFLQLMIPKSVQCSDSLVDEKIKEDLQAFKCPQVKMSCTSIKSQGRLSTCPAGTVVTACSCGYACGSWDIRGENTCHCQCAVMDWATARCCRLS